MDRIRLAGLFSVFVVGCACGSGRTSSPADDPDAGEAPCADVDGDGFGVGVSCDGPDCNDEIAWVHEDEECARLCEDADAPIPGCGCDPAAHPEAETCYLADDPKTAGVGVCQPGITSCVDGVWAPCDGLVVPSEEYCDTRDNDCDGTTDEDVLSACGGCGECKDLCWGPGDGCSPWGENVSENVVQTEAGFLTLDAEVISNPFLWLTASGYGEVLRLDRASREVQAHFQSGPNRPDGSFFGLVGDSPRWGAVDRNGNFVVVNTAPLLQSSLVKFAAHEEDCVDASGDGAIDTSTGFGDILPWDTDECMLWRLEVGDEAVAGDPGIEKPNGIIVLTDVGLDGGLSEHAWISMPEGHEFVEVDIDEGELTGDTVETADDFTPNVVHLGAVDGLVWSTSLEAVGHFDPRAADPAATWEVLPPPVDDIPLNVVQDEEGTTWVSGLEGLHRLVDGEWENSGLFGVLLTYPETDYAGSIWVVGAFGEGVHRIDHTGGDLVIDWIATPGTGSGGIEADPDGFVWLVGQMAGNVTILDPSGDDVTQERILDDCAGPCMDTPTPYGDLSGAGYRHTNRPVGMWSTVAEGCEEGTDWLSLEVSGDVPEGGAIQARVRSADTLEGLQTATWAQISEAEGETDLDALFVNEGLDDARYLEIGVVMVSGTSHPILEGVHVMGECPFVLK